MEAGERDLYEVMNTLGHGLEGGALRDAAAAAALCISSMNSAGMAWTDIKPENFVVVGDEIGDSGSLHGVKAIDVEGAMPYKSQVHVYTPESCPPEYARAWADGSEADFRIAHSFDVWGYGMLLYELATGHPYFASMTRNAITKALASKDFEVDVRDVQDGKLQDLIKWCLSTNPRRRPHILQALLHPYFMTTGIGPHAIR